MPTSGYWHRDAVGPRLKIFFCISTGSNSPTTEMSNPFLDPVPRNWEMFRTDPKQLKSTDYKSFLEVISNTNFVSYDLKAHQILLFDTNCVHRGSYLASPSSEYQDDRILFQLSYGVKESLDLFGCANPYCSHKPIQDIESSLVSRLSLDESVFYVTS